MFLFDFFNEMELIGCVQQAYLTAKRVYNKLLLQPILISFSGTIGGSCRNISNALKERPPGQQKNPPARLMSNTTG